MGCGSSTTAVIPRSFVGELVKDTDITSLRPTTLLCVVQSSFPALLNLDNTACTSTSSQRSDSEISVPCVRSMKEADFNFTACMMEMESSMPLFESSRCPHTCQEVQRAESSKNDDALTEHRTLYCFGS